MGIFLDRDQLVGHGSLYSSKCDPPFPPSPSPPFPSLPLPSLYSLPYIYYHSFPLRPFSFSQFLRSFLSLFPLFSLTFFFLLHSVLLFFPSFSSSIPSQFRSTFVCPKLFIPSYSNIFYQSKLFMKNINPLIGREGN